MTPVYSQVPPALTILGFFSFASLWYRWLKTSISGYAWSNLKLDDQNFLATTIEFKVPLDNFVNKHKAYFDTYSLCLIYMF
jgi:hypothetical protein